MFQMQVKKFDRNFGLWYRVWQGAFESEAERTAAAEGWEAVGGYCVQYHHN